jgi:ATP-dependent DNA ligase
MFGTGLRGTIPVVVAPMLAASGSVLRGDGWAVEPKLDGWRAVVTVDDVLTVRTRRGRDITDSVPASLRRTFTT